MYFKNACLKNFRNYDNLDIEFDKKLNLFLGENAQGKTNLLECIWLFCGGHSFRGAKENELIKFEKDFFKIKMDFYSFSREQKAEIRFLNSKKQVFLNGVEKTSSSFLTEVFSSVVFSPEHLTLIKRGPSLRRKFLDGAICQQKIRYAVALSKYNQIINQRNALLKDIFKHKELKDTLQIWDDSLTSCGAIILKERLEYIKKLKEYAREYHFGISFDKESLDIEYISTADIDENDSLEIIKDKLYKAYQKSRNEDFHTGYTSVGPHRDDMDIKISL